MHFFAGYLGDLVGLDLSRMMWKSFAEAGAFPSPRCYHGMAAAGQWLYIHGGSSGKAISTLSMFGDYPSKLLRF